MVTTSQVQVQRSNQILNGDCIELIQQMHSNSVDFILTDPPYLVNYRDRAGRSIQNDANSEWLTPAMKEAYRVLKQDRLAIIFYGWTRVDEFFAAWRDAGFVPVGHVVFRKEYNSKKRFLSYHHEQAYLLAKGRPPLPKRPLADVIAMPYRGNKFHPTQKSITALTPLIRSFSLPGKLVLDCFAGSGSTCAAAMLRARRYLGIELDPEFDAQATSHLERFKERVKARRTSASKEIFAGHSCCATNSSTKHRQLTVHKIT